MHRQPTVIAEHTQQTEKRTRLDVSVAQSPRLQLEDDTLPLIRRTDRVPLLIS